MPITADEIQQRQNYARRLGWSEDEIARATLIEQNREQTQPFTVDPTAPSNIVPEMTNQGSLTNQSTTVTGRTLLEHQQALQKARAAGDTAAVKTIKDDYDREYQYQKDTGMSAKQEDARNARKDTLQKAQDLLSVIEQGEQGILTGQQYKDALSQSASSYTASKAFGEGGKQLTAVELSILSGQIPVIRKKTGTPAEKIQAWLGGYEVPQTGELAPDETPQRLKNKMIRVINTLDPNAQIPYPTGKEEGEAIVPQKEKLNINVVENAINEVVGFAAAVPDLAKLVYDLSLPGQLTHALQGRDVIKEDIDLFKGLVGGLLEDLSKSTGISYDQEEQRVKFDPAGALVHDWNHPLGTLAYVATFMKVAKLGTAGKAAKGLETAKVGEVKFPKVPPATPGEIGPIKGRVLTSIAQPVGESVTKSEQLMRDALQITKSNTNRGIAKELEAFVPKTGANIEAYATKLDKIIGGQPLEETVSSVMSKVAENSAAQANPELATKIDQILRGKLPISELPGGTPRGEFFATNLKRMNETRKFLNSSISNNWFKNGQPVAGIADQLNALKWEASNALKDLMIEADASGGYFQKAINLQHSALSTAPIMSDIALAPGKFPMSPWGAAWQTATAPVRAITEPIKVNLGRWAAGKPSELGKSIIEGKIPEVPSGVAPNFPATPQAVQFNQPPRPRRPLEPQIIERTLKAKGPAQAGRLMRDMRYKQGNWHQKGLTRKEQEQFLRQSSKKKYH